MADTIPTFPITHPEHGEAVCDERQLEEFSAAGWTKVDTSPKKKTKATPEA